MSLKDSVALVTGGSGGLGLAFATALLKEECRVCVADINDVTGRRCVEELQKNFGLQRSIFVKCDVTSEENFEATCKETVETFGDLDILINNAGIAMETNPRKVLEVNLLGTVIGCQTAIKMMGKTNGGKGGTVINVASIYGFAASALIPTYVASKHGVIGLTRSYGQSFHLERNGVTFKAICPSFTRTPIIECTQTISQDIKLDITKRADLMEPEYVAGGLLKLLKDDSNGATLLVTKDGGYQYIEMQKEFKEFY